MSSALPQWDIDTLPERAQISRQLIERLNAADNINEALVAIVQAIVDMEGPVAAFEDGLETLLQQRGIDPSV